MAAPALFKRETAHHRTVHIRTPGGILQLILPLLWATAAARIVFFGDAMFDRGVRRAARDTGWSALLSPTLSLRKNSDFAVLNLETPLCDSAVPAVRKRHVFRADPVVAGVLARQRFTHAILANNHSMDHGVEGLRQTIATLNAAGMTGVGASVEGDPCAPAIAHAGNDSVAFLAFAYLPGIDPKHVCVDTALIHRHLSSLAARHIPSVVSVHWGLEFSPTVTRAQKVLAKHMAKWGASAVVGHHAHVVQTDHDGIPSLVSGSPVWYGIGNFVFDQWQPWTSRSFAVELRTQGRSIPSWSTHELLRSGPRVRPIRRP